MSWINNNKPISIITEGGYTLEQILDNKHCSKLPKYWIPIANSDKYLFRSSVAESWEFFDPLIKNPISNTNQIYLRFLDTSVFTEPRDTFKMNGYYCPAPEDTIAFNQYWDEQEELIEYGIEIDGVRVTGRYYWWLNFGRLKATEDKRKLEREPSFIDHQYYWSFELEESGLEGPYADVDEYLEYFSNKTVLDFKRLRKEGMVVAKGRRKGYSYYKASALHAYNFTWLVDSKNILAAYEKSHYGTPLKAIHDCLNFINKNTPWVRRREKLNTRTNFKSSVEITNEYGIKVEEGFKSEIECISFMDDPFKGIGDCFSPDTEVIMYDLSIKKIKDIIVGDLLFGVDGTPRKVLSTHNGIDKMTTFSQKKGIDFTVNTKHKHYGYNAYNKQLFTISNEEYLRKSKTFKRYFRTIRPDKININTNTLSIDPYFYGLWLGDGDKDRVSIASEDVEIEDYLIELANKLNLKFRKKTLYNNKASHYSLGGKKGNFKIKTNIILEWLKYNNLLYNKHLIKDVYYLSEEDRLKVLAGLIDSDGALSTDKKRFFISQKDVNLLNTVATLARTLGFYASVNTYQRNSGLGKKLNNISRLTISGDIWNIPVKIKRKIPIKFEHKVPVRESSIKVKNEYIGEYFGFELDGNHLFLLKDFTIVHNSADYVDIEEAGKFVRLLETYEVSVEPVIRDGDIMIGIPLIGGTAGDMDKGSIDLYKMHSDPRSYRLKAYPNIYDNRPNDLVGWFIDDMWYLPGFIEKSTIIKLFPNDKYLLKLLDKYEGDFIETVDEQGNSHRRFAEIIIDEKRKIKKKGDNRAYNKFISQQPKTLSECFLVTEGSPFDVATAKEVLADIKTESTSAAEPGEFIINGSGDIEWRNDFTKQPITEFPLSSKDSSMDGAWVLYNKPKKLNEGAINNWRYIGGCLLPGEKVLTNKGLINVEDIDFNYKLVNKEGKEVEIINVQRRWKEEHNVFKFKMSNTFRTTEFTRGHPIFISNHNLKINWKKNHPEYKYNELYYDFDFKFTRADKIKVGDWTRYPNLYLNKNDFDISILWNNDSKNAKPVDNPLLKENFWWFIGMWLGDGSIYNGNISISLNETEIYYIDKVKDIIKTLFKRSPQLYSKSGKGIEIAFSCKQLETFLVETFNKGSENKMLPEWVKKIDKNYKIKLLQGYLDSDGCILKNNKYYSTEFVSISLELLEGFQDILFSLGIISGLTKLRNAGKMDVVGRLCNNKETYHLRLAHEASINFATLVDDYEDIKIKRIDFDNLPIVRKAQRNGCFISEDGNYIYFQIKKIEERLYTGIVYNFECETHNYISHHISQKNCDPIDFGEDEVSTGNKHSLASTFIMDSITRNIVAEYTGRPAVAEQYYEQLWRGLEYFNAELLYENNLKGLFSYFRNKNKLYLLANEPESLKDRFGYKSNNRMKGFHATPAINSFGRELINKWTLEDHVIGQNDETGVLDIIPKMWTIRSIPLLQEIISWNSKDNFDRISSLGACLVLLNDRQLHIENRGSTIKNRFENDKLFTAMKTKFSRGRQEVFRNLLKQR